MIAFEPFSPFPWLVHGFTLREKDLDVKGTRNEVLARLRESQGAVLESAGIAWNCLHVVEQVHGNKVVVQTKDLGESLFGKPVIKSPLLNKGLGEVGSEGYEKDADGLVTSVTGVALGIYVADCCAIFLVETERHAIGLLHSGRKGTEANIAREGVRELKMVSNGDPAKMIAVLSPCIHRCCYDVDFASEIERQLKAERVGEVWQHPDCTGCHLDRYYSYRREKGRTGRMLAFMMIRG